MAYLRIKCDYCGGKWEVYKQNIQGENARICPHCFQKIDVQTWEKQVVPAFYMADDANGELYKDHCDHKPLFSFDIIANHIYRNKKR